MSSKSDNEFIRGFAIALADLNRLHDQPTMIRDVIDGAGLSLNDFKRVGVEQYDMTELRKAYW